MSKRASTLASRPEWREDGVARAIRGVRVVHPFPTLLTVGATAGLAFVADATPGATVLARMLVAMALIQCAIGAVNDVADRELDAASKPRKPIVAGIVTPRAAVAVAVGCALGGIAIAATLGWASLALAGVGLGCGLLYDLRLKRTVLSALPFMVAIPTLPLWVWVTFGRWDPVLWWLLPLGALIGLSVHMVNTLPDIDTDAAAGVRGLAHRLGRSRAMQVGWGAFAAALALSVAMIPWVQYEWQWYVPAACFGSAMLVGSVVLSQRGGRLAASGGSFALVGLGAAAAAIGWLEAAT
jgi:4-hydroxybenzoate polyprenyltransferase